MTTPALTVDQFARLLGVELWDHQRELAESKAFINVTAAARRTGKTETAEVVGMYEAFCHRACKVLILSAGQDAARRLTESIGARLNANSMTAGAVVDAYATRITLSNRSEIISLPASQKQVRGYGKGVRLVVIDEAGFVDDSLWAAAHYCAMDERGHGSRLMLLGTPWGSFTHFFRKAFQAGQDGDPDYASFQWKHTVNPLLDAAYLERQRDRVSPAEFAAEIEGEWSDAVGSLFSRELLERQTADIEIPALAELQGPARGAIGCDWGVSYDRSAAVGVFRLPTTPLNAGKPARPVFVALPWVWEQGDELNNVVDAVVGGLAHFRYVSPEVNGVGAYPSTELRRRAAQSRRGRQPWTWNFVSTTNASKTTAYGAILGLLEREQLVLPRHPALLRQLAGLKFEQRERGFMHIAAEDSAVHDDVADALMLAMLPYRPPRAHRVVCHMTSLAGSSRAPVDAAAPELDCPVVATGGGLQLYSRPTLQSVGGRDISLYAPAKDTRQGFHSGRYFVNTNSPVGVT